MKPSTLGRLAITALPLGIVMMLVSLSSNIPSYVVDARLGEAALGMFAATIYLIEAGRRVILALGQSASPRLAKYFASGDLRSFQALLLRLIGLGAIAGLAGIILSWGIGGRILALLYTQEYAQHVNVLIAMSCVATMLFASSFLSDALIAARRLRSQVPLLMIVAIATAIGAAQLVPRYELLGAVYAIGIGALCHVSGSTAIVISSIRHRQRELATSASPTNASP